ncbi:hypothetical protein [Paenibacillus sp. CF384]|uniref:hypothetical protein n=1 Tax=Paenibacillus sp. CF384 TaxID=1884382 RepID=UPI0008950AFD|nr:hypothetical protein [Paenibacillus sp. CF384]SDW16153.1 hypothetical protein SAMN05518855_1001474 [Paenibacillus sp. CF384]
MHFVDPGLDRIKNDASFTKQLAEKKVIETLEWISGCHVDAILITCTYFTSIMQDEMNRLPIPVIKIDEPLFRDLSNQDKPIVFVFTNPNTVEGTMSQFRQYTDSRGISVQAESRLISNTFELIMQGKTKEYISEVSTGLLNIAKEQPDAKIVAAQLSMVPAARYAESLLNAEIGHALASLSSHLEQILQLNKREM